MLRVSGAMLRVPGAPPAPGGYEWHFQCSVGVDCSDAEPRCIWLAVLRGVAPGACPRPTPVPSPRRRGPRGLVQRHRFSWAKGRRDGMVSSNENRRRPLSSGEVEGWSRPGPHTLLLQKSPQGFGFTLRHFIVYPPESAQHVSKSRSCQDEENGNATGNGCPQSRLEPMDTIFVKSVKENGPAQQAGLCKGDRLVRVNGESVLGKTYSEVIGLIQNSKSVLELSIMSKDEDVLQLAYSQDAYLRGNEPYTGEAYHLPEPPPPCYPSAQPPPPAPPTAPGGRRTPASISPPRGGIGPAFSALDFHLANHNAAIASATLPPPRKSSLPAPAPTHPDSLCQRALSDWFYSHSEEPWSCRPLSVSEDSLPGLGLRPGPRRAPPPQHRRETLLQHHQAAAQSHDSCWLGGVAAGGGRPCSAGLRAAYAGYQHSYGRSLQALAHASALVPHSPPNATPQDKKKKEASAEHHHHTNPVPSAGHPGDRPSGQQLAEPQTSRIKEEELVGYKSYSPSFCRKADHLLQQATSFREPKYSGPQLTWSPDSMGDSNGGLGPRPQSTPALLTSEEEAFQLAQDREVISSLSLHQEVVRRQNLPAGRWPPSPVESPEPPGLASPCGTPSPVPGGAGHRANGSLARHAFDSLSSIPFIGGIKGRRSSYLLAITTERSKSCDEGLNTFREEGRVFSKLPKRVKSFFTDGSLESLRVQEEARSKRHSTSELGTITFSEIRKEGWLHYKQILTEKGKKVGGSMRPWKRAYTVLHSHSLFLYKDKREAVLHGAGAGPSQEEYSPISIRGCLIDIAYSETKRKNTLRLTTQDFCEYLLQAEDREDMLAWIRIIREKSKSDNEEIGFSRQALINKKLNDYRKHSLTGNKPDSSPRAHRMMPPFLLSKTDNASGHRSARAGDDKALWGINIMKKAKKTGSPKAFGVRLEDCQPAVNHKFVPLIVEMCCGAVEATGLEYTGIYRVPGNNAMVSHLQEHLNKGLDINTAEERWQDLNVISSLLKSFFRKLPEPLFTDDKYNDFIEANRIEDAEDRLRTMKKLICNLPDHYHHTLKFLVGHLKRVADHSEKNKMEPRNLALVFGPTLVRTSEDNMTDMVTHMPDRYKIVETLILHYDWFFSDGELVKDNKTPEVREDMQPVPNIDHLLSNIGRPGMPGEASDSTTSDSVKSKISLGSRKDLNARDLLPKSIISAVTRKRKKSLSVHLPGSSAEEDSEHEPARAADHAEERPEREEERRGKEPVNGVPVSPKKEKRQGKEKVVGAQSPVDGKAEGGPEVSRDVKKEADSSVRNLQRPRGQRTTPPLQHPRPISFLYSHQQVLATQPKPPPAACPPSYLRTHDQSRARPGVPFWVSPSRPPNPDRAQPSARSQAAPLRHRKTRGGALRAMSMNLELELDRSEEKVRGWRTDKVEIIRVTETPAQPGSTGPGSGQRVEVLPELTQRGAAFSSPGPPAVVLRRSALDPRDRTRAWRRHTVVV
ncbi:unnamed protein product [Menidia menidia]|uniref:(Atlantic silverside) hypothetical protein n=1 Tax=Menidia menidia TaxID=238744 RepID=A0A8S4B1W3_9TELE|nr:unnamed protein product [Menidia menidia]